MWGALATVIVSALAGPAPPGEPCPDPAEIEAQLARLGVAAGARPEIEVTGDRMRVLLRGADGDTLGSREVDAPASCHERATVAAVMVATWMGVWPEAAKPATAVAPPAVAPPREPARPADSDRYDLALALAGAFDGNGLAAGIAAESSWRLAGPWRAWVGLSAFTERERAIGPGQASYTRPALGIGPALRLGHGRLRVELGLGGQLGLLLLRGKGLRTTHLSARAVPGASAGLRLLVLGKSLSPFLALGGCYWFGKETATLDDDATTAELPSWDAHLGLGVFWDFGS